MTLSERFAVYQRKAAEAEMMKPRKSPEIHRRIDVSPSAFKRHPHLFEDVDECSYKVTRALEMFLWSVSLSAGVFSFVLFFQRIPVKSLKETSWTSAWILKDVRGLLGRSGTTGEKEAGAPKAPEGPVGTGPPTSLGSTTRSPRRVRRNETALHPPPPPLPPQCFRCI
uniref:Thyroid hormone receptor associated protein 3b n=1 Tax=Nothobranchius kuhntae TaxID=321403 RepID=A0A1A8J6Y2_NOTKU